MEEGMSGFYIKAAGVRGGHGGGNGGGGGTKCGRWNPTTEQVKVLTDLFRSGLRTPSTDQIQKISTQLSFYGKIESKNVFYWFQNHKARERQKRRKVSVDDQTQEAIRGEEKISSAKRTHSYPPSKHHPRSRALSTFCVSVQHHSSRDIIENFPRTSSLVIVAVVTLSLCEYTINLKLLYIEIENLLSQPSLISSSFVFLVFQISFHIMWWSPSG